MVEVGGGWGEGAAAERSGLGEGVSVGLGELVFLGFEASVGREVGGATYVPATVEGALAQYWARGAIDGGRFGTIGLRAADWTRATIDENGKTRILTLGIVFVAQI